MVPLGNSPPFYDAAVLSAWQPDSPFQQPRPGIAPLTLPTGQQPPPYSIVVQTETRQLWNPPDPQPWQLPLNIVNLIGRVSVVTQHLFFGQKTQGIAPAVLSDVDNTQPVNFARASDGSVYMTNGLMPMMKWDGVRYAARTVGVLAPTTPVTLAGSGAGSISGTYTAYVRFLDDDGHPSSLSPISQVVTVSNVGRINYSAVAIPTEAKVARRQILRNLNGEALTYFVDIDTTDLASTVFSSTLSDDALSAQLAVPIVDPAGSPLANRYAIPPNDKPYLTSFLDRMFAVGEVSYSQGHAEVTNGSSTLNGVGTHWTASLVNRFLYVTGIGQSYQILSVDEANQKLTLTAAYQGSTDKFAVYAIRPPPAQRRVVAFSEAGNYEAWPAGNALSVEENDDDITGLMAADGFLYILLRRYIYRLTFKNGPTVDGGLFVAAHRGCVNHRCWVYLEGYAYLMDEQGVYRFAGTEGTEDLSQPIQDLFWLDHPAGERRINWAAKTFFHALHSKDESTIRWFVAMSGSRLPRHALCFNYMAKGWWIEEYAFPVSASTVTNAPLPRPLIAGPARRVFAQGVGTVDGLDPASGTTRNTASGAGELSLTDTTAVFPTSLIAGVPIAIVDGRGKGQSNIIASVSGSKVFVVRPWLVQPNSTSVYQIGGMFWRWRGGWRKWLNEEGQEERRIEVLYEPTSAPAQLDLRYYEDNAASPSRYGLLWPRTQAESDGVQITVDPNDATKVGTDAIVDLTIPTGQAHIRLSYRRERYIRKAGLISLEMRGANSPSVIVINEATIEGAV